MDAELGEDYEAMEAHDKELEEANRPICAICDKPMEDLNYQVIFRPDWLAGRGFNDDLTPEGGSRLGVEIYAMAHCHGKDIRIEIDDRHYRLNQPFEQEKMAEDQKERKQERRERHLLRIEERAASERKRELARSAYLFSRPVVREVE